MASKKQRRRREKDRRHEYEYVYIDEEGHELEVDEAEVAPAKKSDAKPGRTPGRPPGRARRPVQPPSWRRVGRRALVFAPLMFLAITVLNRNSTVGGRLGTTLVLMAFFVPFSYVMDTLVYRAYRRRTGDTGEHKPPRR